MIDVNQGVHATFQDQITEDIDILFAQDLSDDEIDLIIMEELTHTLEDANATLHLSSQIIEDTTHATEGIKSSEEELLNLEKMQQIKKSIQGDKK